MVQLTPSKQVMSTIEQQKLVGLPEVVHGDKRCSSGHLSWFCILVLADFTWERSAAHPVCSCNDQRLGCDFHRPLNLFNLGKLRCFHSSEPAMLYVLSTSVHEYSVC